MLLCIIPLVANLVEEEEDEHMPVDENGDGHTYHNKEKRVPGKCRNDLVFSLRLFGDYQSLLTVVTASDLCFFSLH